MIVVAANARGEIVRYFEAGETASYFGSPVARSSASGQYDAARDGRMIASTGKMLAAIGIANAGRDRTDTLYLDRSAPAGGGLDGCAKGGGEAARGRRAIVAFACSLNAPLEWRAAQLGPGAHGPPDRPVRLQPAAGERGRRGDAAVDGGGARADRRLAAQACTRWRPWCWRR